ncbi:histidine kinase dimerization/phospho-acceptor domain-containing protein [Caballeronia sp. HLA56]
MVDDSDIQILRKFAQQIIKHLEGIQAQRDIRSLRDRLDHAQLNSDQFLAMLAHELRAPLAPILTAVQLLQQVEATLEQRVWPKSLIDRHVRYMSEIVDHLLSASLVSFGAVELELEPASAKTIVNQAIEMSRGFIWDGQHVFFVHDRGRPLGVRGPYSVPTARFQLIDQRCEVHARRWQHRPHRAGN